MTIYQGIVNLLKVHHKESCHEYYLTNCCTKNAQINYRNNQNLPEIVPPFFLENCQKIDQIVEGGDDKHDLAEEDELVPALVAVEQLNGFDAIPRFDAASSEFGDASHHREEVGLRVVDGELEDEGSGSVVGPRIFFQVLD